MVLDNPLVVETAARYGVTSAQLCMRYCLQPDLLPLPKTADLARIANNAEMGFEISATDMDALETAEHVHDYGTRASSPSLAASCRHLRGRADSGADWAATAGIALLARFVRWASNSR